MPWRLVAAQGATRLRVAVDHSPHARFGVLQLQGKLVKAHDGRHDTESEPRAGDRTFVLGAIKALHDGAYLTTRDSRPVVLHDELRPRRIFADAQLDSGSAAGKLDRIVE